MADQKQVVAKGGTMRLGAYECSLKPGTLAARLYGRSLVSERHRHRYEVNNDYRARFEERGFVASGTNEQLGLVEILELEGHPWFLGCQYHPEFQSKPFSPHPLFAGFVRAAIEHRAQKGREPGESHAPSPDLLLSGGAPKAQA
jgi:CTP synthase